MVQTDDDFDSASEDNFSDQQIKPEHLSRSLDIGHGIVEVSSNGNQEE